MIKDVCLEDAAKLKRALDESFADSGSNGKARLPDASMSIGDIVIPARAVVYFTPTKFRSHTEHFRVEKRDSAHAIIFIDDRRGATIRIDGSCLRVDARNCA